MAGAFVRDVSKAPLHSDSSVIVNGTDSVGIEPRELRSLVLAEGCRGPAAVACRTDSAHEAREDQKAGGVRGDTGARSLGAVRARGPCLPSSNTKGVE